MMERQETFAQVVRRPEFQDSFDLGRAIGIIDSLLRWPDEVSRDLAEKFLAQMRCRFDDPQSAVGATLKS